MKIFDNTMTRLEKALDVRLYRQEVLSSNIANAETPGFKSRDVDFVHAFAALTQTERPGTLARTAPGHMTETGSTALADVGEVLRDHVVEGGGDVPGFDGNAVDVDRAMVEVAQNALHYNASTRAVTAKLAILKYVASDGGG